MLCPKNPPIGMKHEKSYFFSNKYLYFPYFGHITPVLMRFVEMDRALLCMPCIGKKVKE